MTDIALTGSLPLEPVCIDRALPATTPDALAKICELEEFLLSQPQTGITTWHTLHAGVYTRTIMIPAGNALTGALVKIPTTLTISGRCSILVGDTEEWEHNGYGVVPASAGRKQAFIAHTDTWLTMTFRTDAKTIEQAEEEFTDDHARLMSRQGVNYVNITGE